MRFPASALLVGAFTVAPFLPAEGQNPTRQSSDTVADNVRRQVRTLEAVRVTGQRSTSGYAAPVSTPATRTDLPMRDTPRTVTIVNKALIADQAMQSMADVARYVPGVSMAAGEGHRDAPTIRGNNTTADFFIDGARDDAQYLRDLYNVERVEVLKGAEALLFGRGGGGGIINRVTKQATWSSLLSATAEGGSFDHRRVTFDGNRPFTGSVAGRVSSAYEKSAGFRDATSLTRYGVNPTVAVLRGSTLFRVSYELFDDRRVVDRGVPSFGGLPANVAATTFFGRDDVNRATSRVNIATVGVEHRAASGIVLRNRTTWADYDKFYQNIVPGAVNGTGTRVSLSAYNHAIARRNLINISDATASFGTFGVRHTLLVGLDATLQHTDQVRKTGYFGDSAITMTTALASPSVVTPVVFRPSPTDANNLAVAIDVAAYVQDQLELTSGIIAVVGARSERFTIDYHNNRKTQELSRTDNLISPRLGLVLKPATSLSIYGSYGVSHLPSAGDQFTSLTVTTATLEPERFTNRELGAKWDVRTDLSLTAAVYRLDRTNTTAPDPLNAGQLVQTGAQRTTGWELGVNGRPMRNWQIVAGACSQRATIVNATTAAKTGATVPLVPATTFSTWNRYQVTRRLGLGAGIVHQTRMYAAIDNTVVLPAFTRADAAVFATLTRQLHAQLNVENLFDTKYFATSQGNNNIMPGAPRTARVSITVAP